MIQVINRALDILEMISKDTGKTFSLTEIANELGLNHATCANIMKTMVQRNYIDQVGHKKGYRLGFMAYQLGGEVAYEQELLAHAKMEMEQLTKALNETSLLGIVKKNMRISLHQEMSDNDLMVKSKIEKPAFSSASGRMIIAMLSKERRQAFLDQYGLPSKDCWKEAASDAGFKKEMIRIAQQGFVKQVSDAHIVGLAVPIFKDEEIVASLSIFLPEARMNDTKEKAIVKALRQYAEKINAKLRS